MLIYSNFDDLMKKAKLREVQHEPVVYTTRAAVGQEDILVQDEEEPEPETKVKMCRSSSLPTIVGVKMQNPPEPIEMTEIRLPVMETQVDQSSWESASALQTSL